MLLVPPVCGRGTTRVQFGLSRSTANSISARSARTKFSLFLVIGFPTLECAPREPALGSSSYRKQAVPNCSGLSGQGIFSTVIQSAYSLGVEPFLVHLKKGLPERVSRDLLNCVADCVGRCGKSLGSRIAICRETEGRHYTFDSHHADRCGRDRPAHAGDEGKLGAMIMLAGAERR